MSDSSDVAVPQRVSHSARHGLSRTALATIVALGLLVASRMCNDVAMMVGLRFDRQRVSQE